MSTVLDVIIQILTFSMVFVLVLLGRRALASVLTVRRRLDDRRQRGPAAPASIVRTDTVRNRFLLWVQSATASGGPKEASKLRRDLSLAGFDQPGAPVWYVIVRFSLAIGVPLLLIFGASSAGKPLSGIGAIVLPLVLCGLGLVAPRGVLNSRAEARRLQMEQQFPDALDLMVVCVEAGLGLEAAFVRVAGEVKDSHPRIAEEFGRMSNELTAGRGRSEALRALAERVNVDAVKSFVALLIQTDALGVSIAQSLRTYSIEMRQNRFLKAEEKAMRIPVLITMPLVGCLMPVIVIALLLPPAIDLVRNLGPALTHSQMGNK
ncbi:MAG TPA: type II secretion system F family protein [Phenylobacterium sp.]|jgi:tight adherence protein C|nr:type II secretion system F family protein [Phenylobacterium sp.]